jgi:hypothetical protein
MIDLRECLRQMRQEPPHFDANRPAASIATAAEIATAGVPEQLLESTVPLAREKDAAQAAAPPPTLGISRAFDSLAATHRLAARTGLEAELDDAAITVKMEKAPIGRLVHSPASARARWSRREVAIFAAGIGIAIVVAGAIVAA